MRRFLIALVSVLLQQIWQGVGSVANWIATSWQRFWFTPVDPTVVCIMRWFAGGMLFYTHLVWTMRLNLFFGERGWQSRRLIDLFQKDSIAPSFWNWLPAEWLWPVHIVCLIILFAFWVGAETRITKWLAYIITVSYAYRSQMANFGLDQVNAVFAFYLALSPCGAKFSVDSLVDRWVTGRKSIVQPSMWANLSQRLMQIHLCVIYLFAGISKLQGELWWNGYAIWNVAANYEYQSGDMTWLAYAPWFCNFLTLLTIAWEISFFAMVWPRQTRLIVLFLGAGMHFGIGAFCGMWTFALMMIFMYLSFLPSEAPNRMFDWAMRTLDQAKQQSSSQAAVTATLLLLLVCSGCNDGTNNPAVLRQKGVLLVRDGKIEEARAVLEKAVQLAPNSSGMHYDLGIACERLGDLDAALEHYSKCIEYEPDYAPAYNNRAVIYARMGNFEAAVADTTEAIERNRTDALAYRNRGLAYHDLGEYRQALKNFTVSLSLNPDAMDTIISHARTLMAVGDDQAALQSLNRALDLNNQVAEVWYVKGEALRNLGQEQEAVACFEQATRLNSELTIPDIDAMQQEILRAYAGTLAEAGLSDVELADAEPFMFSASRDEKPIWVLLRTVPTVEPIALTFTPDEVAAIEQADRALHLLVVDSDDNVLASIPDWNLTPEQLEPMRYRYVLDDE